MLRAIEFFAGSGLVRSGLASDFETVWASDHSAKKQAVYVGNHGGATFHLADIRNVRAADLPDADLAWASFPCQDLSLAGNMTGMGMGTRSGLFWEWIRILWELREAGKLPPVLVAENVVGFLIADDGKYFKEAYVALRELGYRVGAVAMDACLFVPQSRPRAFIVAVRDGIDLSGLEQAAPSAPFHPSAVIRAASSAADAGWVWWSMPAPSCQRPDLESLRDSDVPFDSIEKTSQLFEMLSPLHRRKLDLLVRHGVSFTATAYRRTRPDESGKRVQRLEVRFDGLAGCLRTPDGGSSRQTLIVLHDGVLRSRLLSVRECARLMGAPDSFKLPGTYNDAYRAMGDGVAVPVARWLSQHLLRFLALRSNGEEPAVFQEDGGQALANPIVFGLGEKRVSLAF